MTATFSTSGGNTTIDASWTAPTAKLQLVIDKFGKQKFLRGLGDHGTEETPIIFADLSWQKKLDIWFNYVTMMTLNDAKAFALEELKDAADVDPDDYDLGE